MKTSIIVTTYNWPEALQRVIEALNDQTVAPDEVIVADDGSSTETRECVEALGRRVSVPLIHIWQPDQGFRAALIRNKAVRVAKFDYVVFLDGDCIPDRYFVEDHCRLARTGFFVQGKRVLIDRQGSEQFTSEQLRQNRLRMLFSRHLANKHHLIRLAGWPARRVRGLSGIRSCNLGLWRKDIQAVNGFNTAFTGWGREDSEFVARLYKYGLKRREHPFAAICFHLWHPEQDRGGLAANDDLLARTLASAECRCARGLAEMDETPALCVFYASEPSP
jgi:glycosyltransferase involved in cell wall biosynthesis